MPPLCLTEYDLSRRFERGARGARHAMVLRVALHGRHGPHQPIKRQHQPIHALLPVRRARTLTHHVAQVRQRPRRADVEARVFVHTRALAPQPLGDRLRLPGARAATARPSRPLARTHARARVLVGRTLLAPLLRRAHTHPHTRVDAAGERGEARRRGAPLAGTANSSPVETPSGSPTTSCGRV